jgi:hypothetical protein
MAKLKIRVNEKDGNTVSKYAKDKGGDKIAFVNDHSTKRLSIVVDDAAALCTNKAGPPVQLPITLGPGERQNYLICNAFTGSEFKYTATLEGLTAEDPIIIVDSFSFFDNPNPIIIVGSIALAAGLVVGFLTARYFERRRMTP